MSRALGDFAYKRRDDLPPEAQRVTCFPDIRIVDRTPQDDTLILACDGLWDVMSSEEAIEAIRKLFNEGEDDVALISEEMIDLSLGLGKIYIYVYAPPPPPITFNDL